MALSYRQQVQLRSLESERKKWGYLSGRRLDEYSMLKKEQGVVSGDMKKGKTKFIASAQVDRDMGQALSSALKPDNVEIRLSDKSRGQTDIDTYSGSSVYLSSKARWEDAQVATRRAGNAPALPVIKALLPPAMLNIWLGIEGAQSAVKQADWTHNQKIVTEQQRWLSKRDSGKDSNINLQDLAQRSALGIPFPASEFVTGSHDRLGLDKRYFDWFDQNSSQLEQAVAQSKSLEDLAEVALWVGEELGLVEPEKQQEPDDNPDDGENSGSQPNEDNDSQGESGEGEDEDTDSQDSPPDDSDDSDSDKSDEPDSDSSSDEGEDNQDKPESSEPKSSEPEEDNRTLKDKLKDSIAEAMSQEDKSEPKQDELFDLQAKPDEKVVIVPASKTVTTDIVLDYWAKAVANDFQMPTEEFDDYFGEPQADMLHELKMGILDVFDEDREEAPQLIIAVDVSTSMNCMCKPALYDNYDVYSAGWLAWQVAGLLGQQFPTAEIFAWSTTSSRGDYASRGQKPYAAPIPVGKRPLCRRHEGSFAKEPGTHLMGGTPEAEAMLHAQTLLDSNENSVLVLITDGEPQNKSRAHGVSHAMYQAGTKFSVVTVGRYQPRLEDMHYPPATVVSIKTPKDLAKVSKTFAMLTE
jgi:hypothetical protein